MTNRLHSICLYGKESWKRTVCNVWVQEIFTRQSEQSEFHNLLQARLSQNAFSIFEEQEEIQLFIGIGE